MCEAELISYLYRKFSNINLPLSLQDVISYKIISETARGLSTGPAEYFFIDDTTGEVRLRKTLIGTTITQFVVMKISNINLTLICKH